MIRTLVVLALVSCSHEAACPVAPAPANAAPFLWKVQRGGEPIVWLYGTLHDLGGDDVPRAAWTALDASPRFVSELGDTEPDKDKLASLVHIRSGPGLDSLLDSDHWYSLRDTLAGTIKEDELKRVQPWYALTLLTKKAAPPPKPEMDAALADHASGQHRAIDHLESWDAQLASLVDSISAADLAQAIDAYKTMPCQIAHIKAAYAGGDLAAMGQLLGADQSAKLLTARNQQWLPQIEGYFATGGAFVAVGVSHMAGNDGLPAVLAKAGYTVERQR